MKAWIQSNRAALLSSPNDIPSILSIGISSVLQLAERKRMPLQQALRTALEFALIRAKRPRPSTYPVELYSLMPEVWSERQILEALQQIETPDILDRAVSSLLRGYSGRDPQAIFELVRERVRPETLSILFAVGVPLWTPERTIANLSKIHDITCLERIVERVVENLNDLCIRHLINEYGKTMSPQTLVRLILKGAQSWSEDDIINILSAVEGDAVLNLAIASLLDINAPVRPFRMLYAFSKRLSPDNLAVIVSKTPPTREMMELVMSRFADIPMPPPKSIESTIEYTTIDLEESNPDVISRYRAVKALLAEWGGKRPDLIRDILSLLGPIISLEIGVICIGIARRLKHGPIREWLVEWLLSNSVLLSLEDQLRLLVEMYVNEVGPDERITQQLRQWKQEFAQHSDHMSESVREEIHSVIEDGVNRGGERGAALVEFDVIPTEVGIEDMEQVIALYDVQPEQATERVLSFPPCVFKDSTLLGIIEKMGPQDIDRALHLMTQIQDVSIARAAHLRLATLIAAGDTQRAVAFCRGIPDIELRIDCLATVLERVAHDQEQARSLVTELREQMLMIEDEARHAWKLSETAERVFSVDSDTAIEMMERGVQMMLTLQQDEQNAWLRRQVIEVLARCDTDWALDIAMKLSTDEKRGEALQQIVETVLQREDVDSAINISQQIRTNPYRDSALLLCVRALVEKDVYRARDLALCIRESSTRDEALRTIMSALADSSLYDAITLAGLIESDELRGNCLVDLVSSVLVRDRDLGTELFHLALATTGSAIRDNTVQDRIIDIAVSICARDHDVALRLLNVIPSPEQRDRLLASLASVLSHTALSESIPSVTRITDESLRAETLVEVIQQSAQEGTIRPEDLDALLELAYNIQDATQADRVLSKIVTTFVTSSPAGRMIDIARSIASVEKRNAALREVAMTAASKDLAMAIEAASSIDSHADMQNTLKEIAVSVSKTDLEKGLEIARTLEGRFGAAALAQIAIDIAQTDFERALEIVHSIGASDIESREHRARAYEELTKRLCHIDLEAAMTMSQELSSDGRDRVLIDAVRIVAREDIGRAVSLARQIASEPACSEALYCIVDQCRTSEPMRSLEIALTITEPTYKESALYSLVDILSERDRLTASKTVYRLLALAQGMKNERERACALVRFADFFASRDIDRAIETAESIRDEYYRSEALLKIVEKMAVREPDRAINLALRIRERNANMNALRTIALARAEHSVETALQMAQSITNQSARISILEALCPRLRSEHLHTVWAALEGVEDITARARLLLMTAHALDDTREEQLRIYARHVLAALDLYYKRGQRDPPLECRPMSVGLSTAVYNAVQSSLQDKTEAFWMLFRVLRAPAALICQLDRSSVKTEDLLDALSEAGGECEEWLRAMLTLLAERDVSMSDVCELLVQAFSRCPAMDNIGDLIDTLVMGISS